MTDRERLTALVEKVETLLKDITPGEWVHHHGRLRPGFPVRINAVLDGDGREIVRWGGFDGTEQPVWQVKANAAFIAAAPRLVRELLDAILQSSPSGGGDEQRNEQEPNATGMKKDYLIENLRGMCAFASAQGYVPCRKSSRRRGVDYCTACEAAERLDAAQSPAAREARASGSDWFVSDGENRNTTPEDFS